MAFVSWAQLLADFRNAMATRNVESFFQFGYQNARDLRITYTKLGNIKDFEEWLEQKARDEASGYEEGHIPFAVGGF